MTDPGAGALRNLRRRLLLRLKSDRAASAELARRADLDPAELSRIINRRRVPSLAKVAQLAAALDCEVWELLAPVESADPLEILKLSELENGEEVRR